MYLPFEDLYAKFDSKHVSLDVFAPPDGDAVALEGLRELTLRRGMSVERECFRTTDSADIQFHIQWLVIHNKKNHVSCILGYIAL